MKDTEKGHKVAKEFIDAVEDEDEFIDTAYGMDIYDIRAKVQKDQLIGAVKLC